MRPWQPDPDLDKPETTTGAFTAFAHQFLAITGRSLNPPMLAMLGVSFFLVTGMAAARLVPFHYVILIAFGALVLTRRRKPSKPPPTRNKTP